VPPPARWRPAVRPGFWRSLWGRIRSWLRRSRENDYEMFTKSEGGDASLKAQSNREESESASHHGDGRSID
jgi:hypothetical protein